MSYDIEFYRHLKKDLIDKYEEKGYNGLAEYCVLGAIPIYTACQLILEERESVTLRHKLDHLLQFYGLD